MIWGCVQNLSDPREATKDEINVSVLRWDRLLHKCYIVFYQIEELNIQKTDNELRHPLHPEHSSTVLTKWLVRLTQQTSRQ